MVQTLIDGFHKFRKKEYEGINPSMPGLTQNGQSPDYFIISCIDSRSNPGSIFRPAPGTFLAHKAMGAIVRPYKQGTALAAALQFALEYNKIREIIILGHTGCGAIEALISELEDEEINSFIDVAKSGLETAKEKCGATCSHEQLHRFTEEEIVLQSSENIKYYPSVTKALKEERIVIRPWIFDMKSGNLLEYDQEEKEFKPITDY